MLILCDGNIANLPADFSTKQKSKTYSFETFVKLRIREDDPLVKCGGVRVALNRLQKGPGFSLGSSSNIAAPDAPWSSPLTSKTDVANGRWLFGTDLVKGCLSCYLGCSLTETWTKI